MSKKPGNKYEFITKAGYSLKAALFNLCKTIWRSEKIPDNWQESNVIQMWKGHGPQSNLDNIRHLHVRDQLSKVFGQMVVSEAKNNIFENLSKFQIACKPGHRSSEHLYVIKSVFEQYPLKNKGAYCDLI